MKRPIVSSLNNWFSFPQLADAKKRSDEDQVEIEELQAIKRKQDKEMEALNDRIEELKAENQKVVKSKKKVQEEVRKNAF